MTELEALVALNMIDGIGSVRLSRLRELCSKPQDIFTMSVERLGRAAGIDARMAHQIRAFPTCDLEKELKLAARMGLSVVSCADGSYPSHLATIPGFPLVLYIKGRIDAQDSAAVAIVGSRRASCYGLMNAEKLSFDLCDRKFTVVSGMARGIDTAAHRGALKRGGRTIAVLGSGLGHIYPEENKDLAEEIAKAGAVISEFPLFMPPLKRNFPRRNRIISGLSLGVVVVEAARNSGALITADFALEQGKEVFALPGKVDSRTSFGSNALIRQGAALVSCVDDIMEGLNLFESQDDRGPSVSKDQKDALPRTPPLKDKDADLCDLIPRDEPLSMDEIAQKSRLSIPVLSDILLRLEIRKVVTRLAGKRYRRNN